jgi:tRNA pseudouridine55 synthase
MTSNRALQRVRRLLQAKKAGHTGSLDPSATGMLPLCFGEATKVCAYLLDADKTYRVKETATAAVPELTESEWAAILAEFLGESTQVPPMYSALKKDGKRLYELARKGETVERQPRPLTIHDIRLLEVAGTRLVFRVHCSKGTYVRTLVEDIAKRAGTVAHTIRLHRESVADFNAADMLDLDTVESLAEAGPEALRDRLLAPDVALMHLPAVHVDAQAGERFSGGQAVAATGAIGIGMARVYSENQQFLGVGELSGDDTVAPRRVFQIAGKNP